MRAHSTVTAGLVVATLMAVTTLLAQQPGGGRQGAQRPGPAPGPLPPGPPGTVGMPLAGLSARETAAFMAGLEEFQHEETAGSGLGPIFNDVSCVACHRAPAVGGTSNATVTRFGLTANGAFDPLTSRGGSLLQRRAITPQALERVPPEANVVAQRQSTPLFGLGLIEAIPDAAIEQNAQGQKPFGIRGRVSRVLDVATGQMRVGRFGWKGQQATLLSFSADAYLNEMGITSRLFPTENAPNGNAALLAQFDAFADPEDESDRVTGKGDIDVVADFMRLLAPLPAQTQNRDADAGEAVFSQVGCAVCHRPAMVTGPSPVRALEAQRVALYSDLLLHDMGELGDGITQGAAGPREFRTPPLWGVRASGPYLHDGRARTLDEAIQSHAGEATDVRARYRALTPTERDQLLRFLNGI